MRQAEKFKTGRFGEQAVRDAKWRNKNERVLPVYLEEADIKAIQEILDKHEVGCHDVEEFYQ